MSRISNTYIIQPGFGNPIIRTRDRVDRVTRIHHLAVNTIKPLDGNSVNFQDKVDMGANEIALTEMSTPAGIDGLAILYAEDAGGGLTKLMVEFNTGVPQVVATETP